MLLYKKNPKSILEIEKEAPSVGEPYHSPDPSKPHKFYESDPDMNSIIGGYAPGPEHSYARELMKKYPLTNE